MSYFLFANEEESNSKINLDILYEKKQSRDLKQLSIFNKILNRIHTRIEITGKNKRNDRHIWFNVPEYIFGEPLYDKNDCIAYLVIKLEDNGFLVKYLHPNTLFVSWHMFVPSYIRTEFKKKTGKLMDDRGNISDNKKTENVDTPELVNAGLIANGNVNDKSKKDFTPIHQYKPTGKFVYNPEILEKIEKKVSFG